MPEEEDYVNKRDRIIAAMYELLPATTCQDLTTKVARHMRERVSLADVYCAMAHLRKHSAGYGWTIPHVRRGVAREQDENRFFALPVDRDGTYVLDETVENRDHLHNGSRATMLQTATMMVNQCAAIRIAVTHTRSINTKAKLNDLADDFAYIARKAAAAVREMEQQAA